MLTQTYHATEIADAFILLYGDKDEAVTHLKLQKLVFLAHAFCLAKNSKNLVIEQFEAWSFGPVVPDLYKKLKVFGAGFITSSIEEVSTISDNLKESLYFVMDTFGDLQAYQLVDLTHRTGSPWNTHYIPGNNNIIPNEVIKLYYQKMFFSNDG